MVTVQFEKVAINQAKVLTPAKINQVISAINKTRKPNKNLCIFYFSVKTALRVGEISNLKKEYVCNSDGSVGDYLRLPAVATKGHYGARKIKLAPALKEALQQYLFENSENEIFAGSSWLFQNSKGQKHSADYLRHFFTDLYQKKCEFGPGYKSHSGRRTRITQWLKNYSVKGASLRDVAALTSHSNISNLMLYIDHNEQAQEDLASL